MSPKNNDKKDNETMQATTEALGNMDEMVALLSEQVLGEHMRRRRGELRLSQRAAADKVGLTEQTWRSIEHGDRPSRRAQTLEAVEQALDWPRGTARRILAGEDDVPVAGVHRDLDYSRGDIVQVDSPPAARGELSYIGTVGGTSAGPTTNADLVRLLQRLDQLSTEIAEIKAALWSRLSEQ